MTRSLALRRQSTPTTGIFYHWPYQKRWTRSQVLSHWIHYWVLLHKSSSREYVNQVPQVHHEPQGLSILLENRSVSEYNAYLVNYNSVEWLFKYFQMIIFVWFMFLYRSYTFIALVQRIKWRLMAHIDEHRIVHQIQKLPFL